MDEKVKRLKTPKDCLQFAENVRDKKPELARQARRRAVELRALAYGTEKEVEIEILKAVYAYEEVLFERNQRRTSASRTWQMIKNHGIIKAAARAVTAASFRMSNNDRRSQYSGLSLPKLLSLPRLDGLFQKVQLRDIHPENLFLQ